MHRFRLMSKPGSLHCAAILSWTRPRKPLLTALPRWQPELFDAPLALITLIDEDRQWFKTCQGPLSVSLSLRETPRDMAFCAHTILSGDVLVAEDVQRDIRFADNPFVVGDPQIRFYVGAPLITAEGQAVGSLCLLDLKPRHFPAPQREALRDLAASVVSEMELRLAAVNLSASEHTYRQMFADNPHPMWVYDAGTLQFLAVNDTALTHYGYTRDEFLTMTLCDIRPSEEWARLEASQPGRREGNKGLWRHRKKSGEILWVEITSHAIDFHGRSARMVIANDVSQRLLAEEARSAFETMAQGTLDGLSAQIAILDAAGEILAVNRVWRNFAAENSSPVEKPGGRQAPGVGDNYLRVCDQAKGRDSEEAQQVADGIRAVLSGKEKTFTQEYPCHSPTEQRWFNLRVTPFPGDGPVRVIVAHENITERKQAEKLLTESRHRYKSLVEHHPSAVCSIDQSGVFLTANSACERLIGYSTEELTGKSFTLLVAPEYLAEAQKRFTQALQGLPQTHELVILHKSGHRVEARLTTVPILVENTITGVYVIAEDIGDRVALEAEREELLAQTEALLAEALERADHDPLTGLLNHRAFHKQMENEVELAASEARPLALLLLDLDNFKFFNDSYGHLAGDDLLRQVAQILNSSIGLRGHAGPVWRR